MKRVPIECITDQQPSRVHRRLATLLVVLGMFFGAIGVITELHVFFALSGTAIVVAVLTYSLFSDTLIPVVVSESIYTSYVSLGEQVLNEQGSEEKMVYIPLSKSPDSNPNVRVVILKTDAIRTTRTSSIAAERTGSDITEISILPTGAVLYNKLHRVIDNPRTEVPDLTQLSEVLVNGFELAETVTPLHDEFNESVTVGIDRPLLGSPAQFDHPISSLLGTGLAVASETPIIVEAEADDTGEFDYLLTLKFEPDELGTGNSSFSVLK